MQEKTIETKINFSQIEDLVASQLHAYGAVPENAEIIDIDFGETRPDNVVPLKVKYRQLSKDSDEVKEVSVN